LPTSPGLFYDNKEKSIEKNGFKISKRDTEILNEQLKVRTYRHERSKSRNQNELNQSDKKPSHMKHSSDFLITSNVRKYSSDFLMNSNVSYPESNCNSAKNESLKCIVEETILSNNKNPNDSSWL